MKILLIDTCGATGSIALAEGPAILDSASLPGRSASERLVLTIKDLAARTHTPLASLEVIAVVHGPGSFTGVRVGLSAAKGLSEALNLPLLAISRLAVLTHLAGTSTSTPTRGLFDAGRGEFYAGLYLDGIRQLEALLTREELLAGYALDPAQQVVACEPALAESIATLNPQLLAEPTAADALPLALRRIQQQDFDDPATIDANYLRRTDAEIFAKPALRAASKSAAESPAR